MGETYTRDPVELSTSDGFAYSGKTAGFIPRSIFYKEETANKAFKPLPGFFQDFGIPDPREKFWSIDEEYLLEITVADLCQFGERWLLSNGYHYPREERKVDSAWVPVWPPMLTLVQVEPEWRSVDFEEDILKREERKRTEELDREIRKTCSFCSNGFDLALMDGLEYVHGSLYDKAVRCTADFLHEKRMTVARYLHEPRSETA